MDGGPVVNELQEIRDLRADIAGELDTHDNTKPDLREDLNLTQRMSQPSYQTDKEIGYTEALKKEAFRREAVSQEERTGRKLEHQESLVNSFRERARRRKDPFHRLIDVTPLGYDSGKIADEEQLEVVRLRREFEQKRAAANELSSVISQQEAEEIANYEIVEAQRIKRIAIGIYISEYLEKHGVDTKDFALNYILSRIYEGVHDDIGRQQELQNKNTLIESVVKGIRSGDIQLTAEHYERATSIYDGWVSSLRSNVLRVPGYVDSVRALFNPRDQIAKGIDPLLY